MKIKAVHYAKFKEKLYPFLKNHPELTKDNLLNSTRLRWDMFWASKVLSENSNEIYDYLNDDHIDTAIKAAIREYYK